ncbi:MAG TPA: NAD(P)/FAD-dependent oxidoreductase [Ramlibacter sp.]|nr:NAD(P)/FAD-dependent oxidoreductase [Ramlibacter sp.]
MSETEFAVVGGGLAGLSAALQAAQLGRRCTVFTGPAPGGLLLSIESIQGLPGHPEGIPGYDLGPMTLEAAMDAGAECISAEADRLERAGEQWVVHGAEGAVKAPVVIFACGGHLRALGVPGEERLTGKGVSHCASCDAPLLRNRPVAVVGAGDSACQEALTLAAHASEVHLLVRGGALRAQKFWRDRVAGQRKIMIRFGVTVEQVLGEDAVHGVRLAGGAELAVDAVFMYAGLVPNTALLAGALPLDGGGRIVVDAMLRTSAPGLLAAGYVRAGNSGQAAGAAADGIAAAFAAHEYLDSGRWPVPAAS